MKNKKFNFEIELPDNLYEHDYMKEWVNFVKNQKLKQIKISRIEKIEKINRNYEK